MFGRFGMLGLGAVSDYSSLVNAAAARYGLNPALLNAVIQVESSGDPNAISSKGAQGLMQLMPATAASLGVTNPFDPAQNIDAGARYLSQMINQFGSVDAGLAAYNWGPGNVASGAAMPSSVQAYVANVLGEAGVMSPIIPVSSGASTGEPLIDLTGAAASTPTSDILNQIDTTAANVFGTDIGGAGILLTLGIAAGAAWLMRR